MDRENMQTLPNTDRTDLQLPELAASVQKERTTPTHDRQIEFENIVLRRLPQLRRMAMWKLRNREDAEDAVQDALLSAFKHIADFEGRAQMSTWLTAIATNSVRMQLRRRFQRARRSVDEQPEEFADYLADTRPTAELCVVALQRRELMTKLVKALPLSQRTALQLRHADGLSLREAAEALEVPVGTLKSYLARGRARLAQLLVALGARRPGAPIGDLKTTGNAPSAVRGRRPCPSARARGKVMSPGGRT